MIFGRPMPRITTRRLTLLLLGLSILALTFTSTLTASIPNSPTLNAIENKLPSVPKLKIPKIGDTISKSKYNPWRTVPHPPPRQKGDEYKGSSWWADWKWLTPFSSTLGSDDERMLLPPAPERPPIYCYYDASVKKPRGEKEAESELLLTWRRAWWAQGFTPVILGPAEAMGSSFYEQVQRMEIGEALKEDMMRWLAWEAMGGGLLADFTLLPMASMEDDTLVSMRRGGFASVTSWKSLGSSLIAGMEDDVKKALKATINAKKLKKATSILSAVPGKLVVVDKDASALADYSFENVGRKYSMLGNSTTGDRGKQMHQLNQMMNAHLHITWQKLFIDGVEVLKPFPDHTEPLVSEAMGYARALVACPETPKPKSCPPNRSDCTPCEGDNSDLEISTPISYANKSNTFTIGTVPHPWTLAVLVNLKADLDISFIRREAPRDPWLTVITHDTLGGEISAASRVISFKEAVASEFAAAHAFWLQAEVTTPTDLAWRFGFVLPTVAEPPAPPEDSASQDRVETLEREEALFVAAKETVALKKSSDKSKLRASMEAWSMADYEAWRFARAFVARRVLEREEWEAEEKKFAAGAGSEGGRTAWNRWGDLKDG